MNQRIMKVPWAASKFKATSTVYPLISSATQIYYISYFLHSRVSSYQNFCKPQTNPSLQPPALCRAIGEPAQNHAGRKAVSQRRTMPAEKFGVCFNVFNISFHCFIVSLITHLWKVQLCALLNQFFQSITSNTALHWPQLICGHLSKVQLSTLLNHLFSINHQSFQTRCHISRSAAQKKTKGHGGHSVAKHLCPNVIYRTNFFK